MHLLVISLIVIPTLFPTDTFILTLLLIVTSCPLASALLQSYYPYWEGKVCDSIFHGLLQPCEIATTEIFHDPGISLPTAFLMSLVTAQGHPKEHGYKVGFIINFFEHTYCFETFDTFWHRSGSFGISTSLIVNHHHFPSFGKPAKQHNRTLSRVHTSVLDSVLMFTDSSIQLHILPLMFQHPQDPLSGILTSAC